MLVDTLSEIIGDYMIFINFFKMRAKRISRSHGEYRGIFFNVKM
jgi:hypothetical protein